ncbi:MAG: DNA mismatch repair endonuclease MutL [Phycisphaeraceae bacterium]|nr:DNA mismatch repair endonuclease MutL [Phycisphaeraceae bacterium]
MPICKLSQLLINQIAAGEVIERPASVVKELLENSLDAGATRIDIAIEEGGTQLIRIADDGCGIPPDELELAVAPHATSKLRDSRDLEAIETFGFRGEALASIASVSRLRLMSVPRGGDARHAAPGSEARLAPPSGGGGGMIEVSGDQVSAVKPHAGAPGSVVEVRDLFFNTPARRRFMRSAATEFGHIHETVLRAAMVNPRVGFRLTHNGRTVRDLLPDQDRASRCIELLGKELADGLLEFEHEDRITRPAEAGLASQDTSHAPRPTSYAVWGLAGQPSLAKAAGRSQYLCVNGRPIRDRNLQHALKEAYRGLTPPDRFPVAVVFLTVDPAQVDVNVHPTKAEVRFREPSRVHGLVQSAIRQRLLGADLTPKAMADGRWQMADWKGSDAPEPSAEGFVDYFRRMAPEQKSLVFEDLKRELVDVDPKLIEPDTRSPTPDTRSTPILQIADSYIVTEDEHGGILIIDQHALHERVMFEQLRRRVLEKNETLESQRLLMPVIVPRKEQDLDSLRPLLEKIGLEVEPIGSDALAIQAFPSFLFDRKVDPAAFLNDLLDRADSGDFAPSPSSLKPEASNLPLEAALHEVLDMMACKAAVKAGDSLGEHELAELLKLRLEVERSSSCPHGRPTSLRLTIKDLEKQFGRT